MHLLGLRLVLRFEQILPSIYLWGKAGVGWGKRSWLIHFTPEIFQENA
jgi:hypothetical protein